MQIRISHPSGLAIDWIAQNMFIAVSSPTQSKIVVCNLEGEYQTTILSNESNDTSTLSKISSIAVWPVKGKMFWSNVTKQVVTIEMAFMDGTKRETVVSQKKYPAVTACNLHIAVDWIAQNIYWSDPKENVIEVARLTGQYRYVLISGGVDQPSALAVDPESGYLFWSESGKIPLIARAGLDGKKQTILAQEIIMPIKDITLDRKNKRVYWCYSVGSNVLESMDYSGGSKMQLKLSSSIKNAVALNVFENNIYWADTNLSKGNIHIISLSNLSDVSTISMKPYGDSYLKDIKIYSKDAQTGTNPCGVNNGGCAELCLYNGVSAVCACAHGVVAQDGKSCSEYDAFIMYSRVNRIDSIHMTDKSDLNSPFESIRNSTMMKNIIELSYDYKRKTLFYSDIQKGTINSVFFNGSNHRVLLERQGSVEGLAYEYVHNYLYWTCNNDATINKIDLDSPKAQRIVVVRLGQHDKPRGIDIDSCDSRIYWTNWNSHLPSIQRAFFSGFGTESIITTDITMPNALALDHQAEKLFWGDARLDKIERCDYDGTNRIVLSKISPLHPFDMAVYGEFIFWTDWVIHAVLRANKYTGEEVYTLRKNIRRPMGIVAISDNLDACAKTPCRHLNGNCDDICKLDETGQVVCSCFTGKVLMEDNRSCTINTVCSEHDFKCSDGMCIPFNQTCDRVYNCHDKSDEGILYCAMRDCRPGYFKCDNNKCILSSHT
ncbi:low-density lipoprotein receptor-related protein 1-like [Diaphorina citri]|uniref:Low-density lipoprotein receptor-related protein 1-like n=1 Tax=Diaphorina citri TaxID=121845 RepID=A0A1S4E9G6_DIACI|nr:low-density lipoprotein receptor-related protein 1-like [Diaphorina citri]